MYFFIFLYTCFFLFFILFLFIYLFLFVSFYLQVAEDAGIKLMTAFQRRFDPSFARLHKAIADGAVGDPISAILQSRDPSPPPFSYVKGGGGLFKDMAIHDLDIARWLMGARGKNDVVSVRTPPSLPPSLPPSSSPM